MYIRNDKDQNTIAPTLYFVLQILLEGQFKNNHQLMNCSFQKSGISNNLGAASGHK